MKRALVVLAGAALIALLPGRSASADSVQDFTYVAGDVFTGLARPLEDRTVGGRIPPLRPLGDVRFTAVSDEFRLTIDDALSVRQVPVWVGTTDPIFSGCMPIGQEIVVEGVTPGSTVTVWILGPSSGVWAGCGRGGTTGVVTISQ